MKLREKTIKTRNDIHLYIFQGPPLCIFSLLLFKPNPRAKKTQSPSDDKVRLWDRLVEVGKEGGRGGGRCDKQSNMGKDNRASRPGFVFSGDFVKHWALLTIRYLLGKMFYYFWVS